MILQRAEGKRTGFRAARFPNSRAFRRSDAARGQPIGVGAPDLPRPPDIPGQKDAGGLAT
jgi:hypothetical protein